MVGSLVRGLDRARRTAAEQAVATGYVAGWRAVRRLREDRAERLFEKVADQTFERDGGAVQQLRDNLRVARPDLDPAAHEALTQRAVRSYLRYWRESFRLPTWPLDDLVARTQTLHEERLREPYGEGRGVICALPHMGNWDWAGAWACATGIPVTSVAERLRPERLYDEFVAYRKSLGMTILPLTGGDPPMPALIETLRAGGFVCLLADRDLSGTGTTVSLCGAPAVLPKGPAALARMTGAALVPTTCAYRGRRMEITFHEPVVPGPGPAGLDEATQRIADAFTTAIHQDPADWHMMQRVFA